MTKAKKTPTGQVDGFFGRLWNQTISRELGHAGNDVSAGCRGIADTSRTGSGIEGETMESRIGRPRTDEISIVGSGRVTAGSGNEGARCSEGDDVSVNEELDDPDEGVGE